MAKAAAKKSTTKKSGARRGAAARPARKAAARAGSARKPKAKAGPRYTLHGVFQSGPTYKVGLMLSLCGQKFAYRHVALREGAHKQPEFLALNRFGQVPCLVDGTLALCQSGAILEHLATTTGKLGGRSAAERTRAREWIFWDFDRLAPPIYRSRAIRRGFRTEAPDVAAYWQRLGDEALDVLEAELDGRDWLAGNGPTIADVDVYGVVTYAPEGGFDLGRRPRISAWLRRVEGLRGFGSAQQLLPQQTVG